MAGLSEEQRQRAVEAMQEYLQASPDSPFVDTQASLDAKRVRVIEQQLGPIVADYLQGKVALPEFKSSVDGINKREPHWGFTGFKGQMFFNLATNVAPELAELDAELKAAIALPPDETIAKSRLNTFSSYIRRIGQQHVEAGGTKQGRPQPASVPFFVTYFWHVQSRDGWPVYYTNSVKTMAELNLWQPSADAAEDYISFKHVQEELRVLFSEASGQPFSLYDVEHVFWFRGNVAYGGTDAPASPEPAAEPSPPAKSEELIVRLPKSYVPPIVAVLPAMARNDAALVEAAKASNVSLEKAFEESVNAAFTILGFDTTLKGQGQGRVPDGLAVDLENSYGIIWDAKIRRDGYSIGTDDRTMREYISIQSRELKHRRPLQNIYYVVVSSTFKDDYDAIIKSLKMGTVANDVRLVQADALVAMVDAKLQDPFLLPLGPEGIQQFFCSSGILTSEDVLAAI